MASQIFLSLTLVCLLVTLTRGLGLKRRNLSEPPSAEECMQPPMSKHGHECCRLPKERIWGDLRPSFSLCFRKLRNETLMEYERSQDGAVDETSNVSEPPNNNGGRPRGRKPLSERLKELFSSVYKEIKKTFDSLWQSVVIITDHPRRYSDDSCFMECVFEDQGFLTDKILNKEALLGRLRQSLGRNEPWYKVAVAAVELCYQTVIPVSSNDTCQSGSEEVFRCVFKQIFFNCPRWTQSSYCTSLKEFYEKCPNGPPPEINDDHTPAVPPTPTSPAPSIEEEAAEINPTTETETVTEQE